eukprot:258983-Pleurochrysis_carterae.AAC.1
MMQSHRGKNVLGGRGSVKKSAILSAFCTKGTVISRDSTRSRTKKCDYCSLDGQHIVHGQGRGLLTIDA